MESTAGAEDRTASEVFADLKAADSTVDTDAVLEATSPDELIDRADEPTTEPERSSELFDEAAFEANIIPDRESDGGFLWIDVPESDEPGRDRNDGIPADETQATTADRDSSPAETDSADGEWAELVGEPTATRIEDDRVDSAVASLSTTAAVGETDSDEHSADDASGNSFSRTESAQHILATGGSRVGGPSDEEDGIHRPTDESTTVGVDPGDEAATRVSSGRTSVASVGWLEADELDNSGVRTESTGAPRSPGATDSDVGTSLPTTSSVVTDEFDSVSAPGSGRVPTRTDPQVEGGRPADTQGSATSRTDRSRRCERRSIPRDSRPTRQSRSDAEPSDADRGSSATDATASATAEDGDASEVRTTLVSFDRHHQQQSESTGPMTGFRRFLGRFKRTNALR